MQFWILIVHKPDLNPDFKCKFPVNKKREYRWLIISSKTLQNYWAEVAPKMITYNGERAHQLQSIISCNKQTMGIATTIWNKNDQLCARTFSILHGGVCSNCSRGCRCKRRENRKSSNTAEMTKQTVSKCKLMFMLVGAWIYYKHFNKD